MTMNKWIRASLALGLCTALSLGAVVGNAAPDSRAGRGVKVDNAATQTAKPGTATAKATPTPTAKATPTAKPSAKPTDAPKLDELEEMEMVPETTPTSNAQPTATAKSSAASGTGTGTGSVKKTSAKTGPYSNEMKLPYAKGLTLGGAAKVERKNDVAKSTFYKVPDIFNSKSSKNFTLLPKFKTYQQTTEWSSGPAAALTVLNYLGKLGDKNEMDLAKLTGEEESLTSLAGMVKLFKGIGGLKVASTLDSKDVGTIGLDVIQAYLKKGVPVLVEWMDWDGHWMAVIGYHTMGTASRSDDILIVMDPYDTTDHCQDGYGIVSAERFLFMWKDVGNFASDNNKAFVAAWADK